MSARWMLTAALIAAAAPAGAQAPDAARTAAANDLTRQLDVRGQLRRSVEKQIGDLRTGAALLRQLERDPRFRMARSKNPQQFDAVFKRVGAMQASAAERALVGVEPEAARAAADAYARAFTTAELRQLIAFYTTPLGRKLRERLPAITQETQAAMQSRIGPRIADEMRKIAPQMQDEIKRLAPPPAAR